MKYSNWQLDQHPAPMLAQMDRQIRCGQSFVSTFDWSEKFGKYLSRSVVVSESGESLWIFFRSNQKTEIPMWNGEQIVNSLTLLKKKKKKSLKSLCRRLLILRRAYSGTNKIFAIEDEIEKIERENEKAIDEIIF